VKASRCLIGGKTKAKYISIDLIPLPTVLKTRDVLRSKKETLDISSPENLRSVVQGGGGKKNKRDSDCGQIVGQQSALPAG